MGCVFWGTRNNISLGVLSLGQFSSPLSSLETGKTYFYRIIANNAAGSTPLSEVSTFSTGSFGFKSDSFSEGEIDMNIVEDYHSHNTERLDVDGMKKLLLKLDSIREDIK